METIRKPLAVARYDIECGNGYCKAILRCTVDELNNYLDRNMSVYEMVCPHCKINTYVGNHIALEMYREGLKYAQTS